MAAFRESPVGVTFRIVELTTAVKMTGFGDVVPVIREATVKSVLLLAPKLPERTLNNDLLRQLARVQTDAEPGIRTNTCILLGRLSKLLQPSTNRKVLIPAFARALRDPFVHARMAGLMALMATTDCYEKEDIAGKVIPSMSICLIDREKFVHSLCPMRRQSKLKSGGGLGLFVTKLIRQSTCLSKSAKRSRPAW